MGKNDPGEGLYQRVKQYVLENRMIRPQEAVVAGVSGGADSLCLLLVLVRMSVEIGFSLKAVHVHHGLRDSAEEDLHFVESVCRERGVPCSCIRADARAMAKTWSIGTEEAGRRIRYEAFERERRSLEEKYGTRCRIAVAHHREDQAETVLFRLCRGTDLRGAGGMLPVNGSVIRPLLQESRREIEAWLSGLNMSWREDETNADTTYTRNYLRKEILPRLAEGVNPAAAAHIAAFAGACAEAERFLEAMTGEALERCRTSRENVLEISALLQEDPYLQGRVLFRSLAAGAGTARDLGAAHVEALRRLCCLDHDGRLSMPGGITAVRSGGLLFFLQEDQDPGEDRLQVLRGGLPFSEDQYVCRIFEYDGDPASIPRNEYTKWFDYDKIGMFPVFRQRQAGDMMTIRDGKAAQGFFRKKLARVMLDGRIPALLRGRIVLPFRGAEALWIPGIRIGDGFRVTEATKRILEIRFTG